MHAFRLTLATTALLLLTGCYGLTTSHTTNGADVIREFRGAAGDRVLARAVRTSGTGNLVVQIRNASGVPRCTSTPGVDQTVECVVDTAGGSVRVTTIGPAQLNLHVQRFNPPVGYDPPDACSLPGFGSTISDGIDPIADEDCYPFAGSTGDRVLARAVRTSGTGNLVVQIRNANGDPRCTTTPGADQAIDCVVDTAGGSVRVYSPGTGTANFNLHVQRFNPPTGCSPTGSENITPPGEEDCFLLSSSAGQTVTAHATRTSGIGNLVVQIRNANGDPRCTSTPGVNQTAQCTVDTVGGSVRVYSPGTGTPAFSISVA